MEFDWNPVKAGLNWSNHAVRFEIASLVFQDPYVLEEDDPEPSEHRLNAIGYADGRMLFVVFAMRDDVNRPISARPADRRERRRYHEAERD